MERIEKIYHSFHSKSKKVVHKLYREKLVSFPRELKQVVKREV